MNKKKVLDKKNIEIEKTNNVVLDELNASISDIINSIKKIPEIGKIRGKFDEALIDKAREEETIFLFLADVINKNSFGIDGGFATNKFGKFMEMIREIAFFQKNGKENDRQIHQRLKDKYSGIVDEKQLKDLEKNTKIAAVFEKIDNLTNKIKNLIDLDNNFADIKNAFNFKGSTEEEQKKEFLEYFTNMLFMNYCNSAFKNHSAGVSGGEGFDTYCIKYFDEIIKKYQNASDIYVYNPTAADKIEPTQKKMRLENYMQKRKTLLERGCTYFSKKREKKNNSVTNSYPIFLFNGSVADNLKKEQLKIMKDVNNLFISKNMKQNGRFNVVPVDFSTGFGKSYLIEKINEELAKKKTGSKSATNVSLISVGLDDIYNEAKFNDIKSVCEEELKKQKDGNTKFILLLDEFSEFTNDRIEEIKKTLNDFNRENASVIAMPFSATLPEGLLDEDRIIIKRKENEKFESYFFENSDKNKNLSLKNEKVDYENIEKMFTEDTKDLDKKFNLQLILPDLASNDFEIMFNNKLSKMFEQKKVETVFYKNKNGNYCIKYKTKNGWVDSQEYKNLHDFEIGIEELKKTGQLLTDRIITTFTESNSIGGDMGIYSRNITKQLIYTNSSLLTISQLRQYIGRNRDNENGEIKTEANVIIRNPICKNQELLRNNDTFFGNYTSIALEELKVKNDICEFLKKCFAKEKLEDTKLHQFIFSNDFDAIYNQIRNDIFVNNEIRSEVIELFRAFLSKKLNIKETPENAKLLRTDELKNLFTKLNNTFTKTNNILSEKNFNCSGYDLKGVKNYGLTELASEENFILKDIDRLINKINICRACYTNGVDANSQNAVENIGKYKAEMEKCIVKLNQIRENKKNMLSSISKEIILEEYNIKKFYDFDKIDFAKKTIEKSEELYLNNQRTPRIEIKNEKLEKENKIDNSNLSIKPDNKNDKKPETRKLSEFTESFSIINDKKPIDSDKIDYLEERISSLEKSVDEISDNLEKEMKDNLGLVDIITDIANVIKQDKEKETTHASPEDEDLFLTDSFDVENNNNNQYDDIFVEKSFEEEENSDNLYDNDNIYSDRSSGEGDNINNDFISTETALGGISVLVKQKEEEEQREEEQNKNLSFDIQTRTIGETLGTKQENNSPSDYSSSEDSSLNLSLSNHENSPNITLNKDIKIGTGEDMEKLISSDYNTQIIHTTDDSRLTKILPDIEISELYEANSDVENLNKNEINDNDFGESFENINEGMNDSFSSDFVDDDSQPISPIANRDEDIKSVESEEEPLGYSSKKPIFSSSGGNSGRKKPKSIPEYSENDVSFNLENPTKKTTKDSIKTKNTWNDKDLDESEILDDDENISIKEDLNSSFNIKKPRSLKPKDIDNSFEELSDKDDYIPGSDDNEDELNSSFDDNEEEYKNKNPDNSEYTEDEYSHDEDSNDEDSDNHNYKRKKNKKSLTKTDEKKKTPIAKRLLYLLRRPVRQEIKEVSGEMKIKKVDSGAINRIVKNKKEEFKNDLINENINLFEKNKYNTNKELKKKFEEIEKAIPESLKKLKFLVNKKETSLVNFTTLLISCEMDVRIEQCKKLVRQLEAGFDGLISKKEAHHLKNLFRDIISISKAGEKHKSVKSNKIDEETFKKKMKIYEKKVLKAKAEKKRLSGISSRKEELIDGFSDIESDEIVKKQSKQKNNSKIILKDRTENNFFVSDDEENTDSSYISRDKPESKSKTIKTQNQGNSMEIL